MNAAVGVGAGLLLAAADRPTAAETSLFWVLAPAMVIGALGLLFARKAVHAALSMAVVMVGLGVVYLVQEAPLLGVVQVFVYTGAVMMLFLFVVMLIGISSADSLVETIRGQRVVGFLFGTGLAVLLVWILGAAAYDPAVGLVAVNKNPGNITAIAHQIFSDYVWAFELTSALLITAALGAMTLTHRERIRPRLGQRELSEQRIAEGPVKGPLPGPGVFARHNAVGTPALLPDGTPSELSVSRVLTVRGQVRSAEETMEEIESVRVELGQGPSPSAGPLPGDGGAPGGEARVGSGADTASGERPGGEPAPDDQQAGTDVRTITGKGEPQ